MPVPHNFILYNHKSMHVIIDPGPVAVISWKWHAAYVCSLTPVIDTNLNSTYHNLVFLLVKKLGRAFNYYRQHVFNSSVNEALNIFYLPYLEVIVCSNCGMRHCYNYHSTDS